MRKTNSFADTAATGRHLIEMGDGTTLDTNHLIAAAQPKDTGWRLVPADTGSTGSFLIRRVGDRVTLRLNGILPPAGNFATHVATVPSGFEYSGQHFIIAGDSAWSEPASIFGMYSGVKISWLRTINDTSARPVNPKHAEYSYLTTAAWPTTLPGTPA